MDRRRAARAYTVVMTYAKAASVAPSLKLFWAAAKAKQQVVPQTSLLPAATQPTVSATSGGLIGPTSSPTLATDWGRRLAHARPAPPPTE